VEAAFYSDSKSSGGRKGSTESGGYSFHETLIFDSNTGIEQKIVRFPVQVTDTDSF
jgi:hypothetical protein